jgi:hypothetical protein
MTGGEFATGIGNFMFIIRKNAKSSLNALPDESRVIPENKICKTKSLSMFTNCVLDDFYVREVQVEGIIRFRV